MAYSFTNPVVDAKIWEPGGGEIDLSIFGSDDKIPYVQSVSITTNMSNGGEISIELSPPYREAIRLLDETAWFKLGNHLGVRWGYNDGQPGHISDWIYGMMLLPELDISEEIRLTIKANTYGIKLDMEESAHNWSNPDAPVSFFSVIEAITKKYGLKIAFSVGGKDIPASDIGTAQSVALTTPNPYLIQGGLTDLQFVYRFLRTNGMEMSIVGNRLVIYPNPELSEPAAEFHLYGKIDPSKNIYPMTSFSPKSMGVLFLPHSSYTTVLHGFNSDPTAIVEKVSVTGAKGTDGADKGNYISGAHALETPGVDGPANPETGLKSNVAQDPVDDCGKFVPIPIPEDMVKETAQGVLSGLMDENAQDFGISVNVGSLAIPTLFPNQVVRLRGVSRFFSTDYRIREISVQITSGDATMELDCCAKGIAPDLANWAAAVTKSEQGETQPGDGGEDVPPDPGAGE